MPPETHDKRVSAPIRCGPWKSRKLFLLKGTYMVMAYEASAIASAAAFHDGQWEVFSRSAIQLTQGRAEGATDEERLRNAQIASEKALAVHVSGIEIVGSVQS